MNKHIEYNTRGTCSRKVIIDIEDDVIVDCKFIAGCPGNTLGVSTLVKGMTVKDAISKLKGIKCGMKSTSCPDQLALALEEALVAK